MQYQEAFQSPRSQAALRNSAAGMPRVCQQVPTAFPQYQCRHSSQQIARSHLPFSKRESIIFIGRGGAARPVTGGAAGPVHNGGGATRPLADDAAEGPVAAGGGVASPVADDGAERSVAGGGRGAAGAAGSLVSSSAAELFAAGGGGASPGGDDNAEGHVVDGGGGASPLADDGDEEPVAGCAARPVAGAADEDASVGPITEGARPVAGAAGRDASAVGPAAKAASAFSAAKV